MERLDAARIAVPGITVRVLERCSSTNTVLLAERGDKPLLLAAEAQSAGRGRRGRRWYSSPGDITFSLARDVRRPLREFAALSLVAGVAVAQALRRLGVADAALKWPNDLVVHGAKLGGILVETRGHWAVIGVGINWSGAAALCARLRRRVAALDEFISASRNVVVREVAGALVTAIDRFDALGFEAARAQWESMDACAGRRLRVRLADGRSISGTAAGLAADGALRVLTRSGERLVRNGRIIGLRPA